MFFGGLGDGLGGGVLCLVVVCLGVVLMVYLVNVVHLLYLCTDPSFFDGAFSLSVPFVVQVYGHTTQTNMDETSEVRCA